MYNIIYKVWIYTWAIIKKLKKSARQDRVQAGVGNKKK